MTRKLSRRAFAAGAVATASFRFAPAIAQAVPFRIVKRVMYSCGVAGYFNVNLATLDAGSYAATARQPGEPAL